MQNSKNLSKNLDKVWQGVRQTLIEKNIDYGNSFFETADTYGIPMRPLAWQIKSGNSGQDFVGSDGYFPDAAENCEEGWQ